MKPLNVIISGGGTGGHIFPAVAIARAILKKCPDAGILFVGANGKMEMEKVPAAGFRIVGLDIAGLQRKLTLQNLSFPFKVIKSVLASRRIVKEFKPDVVVGVGGFASGPLLYAATGMGIPALVQEQNSYPGITNKLLAKRVQRICVAYENMDRFFPAEKIVMHGNPVRADILEIAGKKPSASAHFGLDPQKPCVLVIGGSLGARTLNESLESGLEEFASRGIQVIWQTGKGFFERAKEAVRKKGFDGFIKPYDFIQQMDLAYAMADVVISRAGASSVSELCIVAKASVLVPSPNVAEDHQTKNAMALVNKQAALMVKDVDARQTLVKEAVELLNDPERIKKMQTNMAALALPGAADKIADEVLKLAGR